MAKRKEQEVSKYASASDVHVMLQSAQEAEWDQRQAAREAVLFLNDRNGQWEPFWWSTNDGKPRYTFDMTSPIVDQHMRQIEESAFDIRVSPAGGQATKETAQIYDGVIRNIENMSNAPHVYKAVARGLIASGFDAMRVVQKYVDDDSFEQDLIIEHIPNAIDRVWWGPSERQDRSDAPWCVVLHAVSKEAYEARWPEGSGQSVSEGRQANAYYQKPDLVIIGEMLYYEESTRELALMSNGRVYPVDENYKAVMDELKQLGITEDRRRKTTSRRICSRFFDGSNWLEEKKETVFSLMPVAPAYGNFWLFEDKILFQGVVEKLYDPQRVLNYSLSREIEEGALAPRAKYWMTPKQATGHEKQLATLNTNADPVQFYNNDPEVPGPPQQNGGAQINPGLHTISETMRSMISYTSSMFAANMGDNPGLQSGVAIDKLQTAGEAGSNKYVKALEFAITYLAKVLIKAIPKVYDTQRQMRLMYEDGSTEIQTLNQEVLDQQTGRPVTLNDLSQGQYDVVCRAGPSFKNKQEETVAAMTELAKVDPSILQIGGDLFLKAINTPVADQLAERKRAMMLAQGLIPESEMTDEEKQAMAQKAQGQQAQDPAMVLAMAEMKKAEAEAMNAQNNQMKLQIEGFNAETKRIEVLTLAKERGMKVEDMSVSIEGKRLDNVRKVQEIQNPQPRAITQ
jgi:hypothetical protein